MTPATQRFFNPTGADRVAVVSVEPATEPGRCMVRVGRGRSSDRLTGGAVYGPYDDNALDAPFSQAVEQLRAEGFLPSGLHALLQGLQHRQPATRAQAALRIGWRRDEEAVDALLTALTTAVDDACSILDALGMIGDSRAIPVLREYASRKLLSRRRSAVEALRNLGDDDGLAEARERALERLPASIADPLRSLAESDIVGAVRIASAVQSVEVEKRGLALDTLYELGTPLCIEATRLLLRKTPFDQPHLWRYVKSVFKRSMLRQDHATFGEIAHAIEHQGRTTTGTTASVKSGYDGIERSTNIFRQKTQNYLRRLAWRYLRRLAKYRPEAYPYAAAEAIIHYSPEDAEAEQDLYGPYASCYLLHRVAFGASDRLVFDSWRMKYRYTGVRVKNRQPVKREEAFPELWDAEPRAYLRVLGAAKLPEAHVFAVRALTPPRMQEAILGTASHEEIIALLHAPYEPTVELGLQELDRRFDPARPDLDLVTLVLSDERPIVRDRAREWVRLSAPVWTRQAERVVAFLAAAKGDLLPLVIELAGEALRQLREVRQQVALRFLVLLRRKESTPGEHEAYAALARESLLEEFDAVLSLDDVLDLVTAGSPAAQSVGGEVLARRPHAFAELGLERMLILARHEVVNVRQAAHKLLRAGVELLRRDPSALFELIESDWPDTRDLAGELLKNEVAPEALGLDGIMGLVDSNRLDVQQVGCDLVRRHFAMLPTQELLDRLVQHPHPALRRFTLEMVTKHLGDGADRLAVALPFCRAALLDLWPSRKVKRGVVAFLGERGLRDPSQAALVASVLNELVRVQGRADFEQAMEALVKLKLAFPELETAVKVRQEEGG